MVTEIETIWIPTVSYVVWEPASTTTPAFFTPRPAVTVEGHNTSLPVKRDIVPRTTSDKIPSYASAYFSSTAYASACFCIGVNVTPSPVIYVFTTTVTKTVQHPLRPPLQPLPVRVSHQFMQTSRNSSTLLFKLPAETKSLQVCAPDNDYGFIYSNDFGIYTNNLNISACPNPAGGLTILIEFSSKNWRSVHQTELWSVA